MLRSVLLLLASGCTQGTSSPAPIDLDRARTAVIEFFAAATNHDCKTVMRMRITPLPANLCEDFVAHFGGERGTSLTEILTVTRDGRAAHRAMVKANVRFAGEPHEWIIPVERRGDDYKVDVQ